VGFLLSKIDLIGGQPEIAKVGNLRIAIRAGGSK
jgi:hypothetical protein